MSDLYLFFFVAGLIFSKVISLFSPVRVLPNRSGQCAFTCEGCIAFGRQVVEKGCREVFLSDGFLAAEMLAN